MLPGRLDEAGQRVLLGEVTGIDVECQQVILRDGVVGYDKLIVAAGAGSSYFGKNEWETHAPSLKSIEDATEIRRRILYAFGGGKFRFSSSRTSIYPSSSW